MFGYRPDGRRVRKGIDPIILFTPYIMPTRNDAQVFSTTQLDYESMSAYIRKNKGSEHPISFMTIIIAAYVQTVGKYPIFNRFISNKQIFQRNEIVVSFTALRKQEDGSIDEALVKIHCDPRDTIFDIARKMEKELQEARKPQGVNKTVAFARFVLSVPGFPNLVVGLARLLDRYGLLPRAIIDISPFHCGLFITNMASLGMPLVYHHLYNFGTTTIFWSMGKPERSPQPGINGSGSRRNVIPCGVVVDERVCSGEAYARGFQHFQSLLRDPEQLETPFDQAPKDEGSATA